jgi:hypothetical protein
MGDDPESNIRSLSWAKSEKAVQRAMRFERCQEIRRVLRTLDRYADFPQVAKAIATLSNFLVEESNAARETNS